MKKQLIIIALAGIAFISCTTNDDIANKVTTDSKIDPVFIYDNTSITRNSMSYDLVNTWVDGDNLGIVSEWDETKSGTFIAKGKTNAKFTYYNSFVYKGHTYTNRFAQEGVIEGTLSQTDMIGFDNTPDAIHFASLYNFYVYYPYNAAATSKNSIPFTLSSTQTQKNPNVWTSEAANYNFMWDVGSNFTRPADLKISMMMRRLLPVAEFNIIRDDATLDGYYLTGITMTPTSGTMATGAVTNGIDLTAVSGYSSLTFGSTTAKYSLDTKGTGSGIQIVDANVMKDQSFSVYMSVPPVASAEYTIVATFVNGTVTKCVTVTRSDAFTITNGKGNLVRYYLKTSKGVVPETNGNANSSTQVTVDLGTH
ncbi:MAG: hypothetical protein LKG25_05385 [Prevotella sp.]|jgi:hypothetical protein|nr:hypothetical protein [Prevotella sp.]MCI1282009.1 hypothetical protein [Prevotella sp.]